MGHLGYSILWGEDWAHIGLWVWEGVGRALAQALSGERQAAAEG